MWTRLLAPKNERQLRAITLFTGIVGTLLVFLALASLAIEIGMWVRCSNLVADVFGYNAPGWREEFVRRFPQGQGDALALSAVLLIVSRTALSNLVRLSNCAEYWKGIRLPIRWQLSAEQWQRYLRLLLASVTLGILTQIIGVWISDYPSRSALRQSTMLALLATGLFLPMWSSHYWGRHYYEKQSAPESEN